MTDKNREVRPGGEELGHALTDSREMTSDWAPSWLAVDRARFLPDHIWPHDHVTGTIRDAISRSTDPRLWSHYADSNAAIVTQWDDGAHTGRDAGAVPTSSASQPSLVMAMLRDLEVEPGMRVLEIGTGTGWTAGLLTHRLGNNNVVTVDVDADVADAARRRLYGAGLRPTVIARDGLEGDPPGAPYDRIIATCGLRSIPTAWIEQVKPGGIILAPYGTHYSSQDALAKLTVAADGKSASGEFRRPVQFMKARAQRDRWPEHADYVSDPWPATVREASTDLSPDALGGTDAAFVLGLLVPAATHTVTRRSDGRVDAWFYSLAEDDRSWAAASWNSEGEPGRVCQDGRRALWTEVENGLDWWAGQDQPPTDCFGLTVDATGEHLAWLDRPDNLVPLMG
ncbi:methyltransferase domain-containing protein [Streptomyces sp. 184]|uniref:methyltransferase domain-containing protein n=1 Tax=Streptomyces sp. 184 TaxID=1827526 RepID=UPI00389208A0